MGKPVEKEESPDAEKWAAEYRMGGIPSSVRTTPSGAVVWAVKELSRYHQPLRTAADIGCGKGRNSIFLAERGMNVTAMDFTPNAIRHLQEAAAARGLEDKIRAVVHDVTDEWPVADASMDLIVDAFCFKHLAPYEARLSYRHSLLRALRSRGHYLISFASIGDGYYGQYVLDREVIYGEEQHLVIDPVNGIQSTLFTRKGVLSFFAPELVVFKEIHNDRPSVMHGQSYERDTYALLLQRNPHHLL